MTDPNQILDERRAAYKKQQRQRQMIFGGLFALGLIVTLGLGIYAILQNSYTVPELEPDFDVDAVADNSISVPVESRLHLEPGEAPPEYNSNPPTSGKHHGMWISPIGVYPEQLPDERVVHNLEHGHVWLTYRDEDDSAALALFTAIQEKYPDRIVVSYRPQNDTRIAASAWGRLLTLDTLDREQLEAFIVRHSDNAPESILEGPR